MKVGGAIGCGPNNSERNVCATAAANDENSNRNNFIAYILKFLDRLSFNGSE